MDKLKKVFSPGSKKDDEVLYGDAEERRRESVGKAPEQREPETLRPTEDSHKKEHSILKQIINPGGEKYDDQRYGTTATTDRGDPNKLETHPEASKDHTIIGQILNPGGDKYDERRFSATASTQGDGRRESVRPEAPPIAGPDTKLQTDPEEKKHEHSILRQIINPGGAKYDQEGYGTTAHAAEGGLGNAPSDTKDHSIARQILNPGQEKYDPVVHGGSGQPGPSTSGLQQSTTTAGVVGPFAHGADTQGVGAEPSRYAGASSTAQQSLPAQTTQQGEGTNFGRDAAMVGGAGAATGAGAYAYNQHEKQKDNVPTTTNTTTTTTTTTSQHPPLSDRSVDNSRVNPIGAPASDIPQQTGDSHLGRDAAIAGGVGGAGLGAVALGSQVNKPRDDLAGATYTERSQPLAGSTQPVGSTSGIYAPDADGAMGTGPLDSSIGSQQTSGTGAHINPVGAPEHSLEGQPHLGRDVGIAGGAAGAGIAAGDGVTQLNKAPADVQQATYTERAYPIGSTAPGDGTYHHLQGPHPTDIGNRLDPHVPGEFPTATGEDRHDVNPTALAGASSATGAASSVDPAQDKSKDSMFGRISAGVTGMAAAGAAAVGLSGKDKSGQASEAATGGQDYPVSQPTAPSTSTQQPSEHHYGRDAAVAGGLGAAGAGAAYAATRDHDKDVPSQDVTSQATSTPVAAASKAYEPSQPISSQTTSQTTTVPAAAASQAYQPTQQATQATEKADDHHYGRDAALAGGAGAAGIGAYEATKGRDDTGPASKTVGPHESNIANVVDPRVPMQPEKMKDSQTAGPHSSDMANKVDPRVEADPAKNEDHHYGRDAAIAGGAGVAGAGAYETMKEGKQPVIQQQTPSTYQQRDPNDPAVIAAQRAGQKEAQPSRDAAAATGAAGTGAAAEKVHDDKHDKKLQKAHEKELEKEDKKAQKAHEKDVEKEDKKTQKAFEKEQEKQDKKEQKAFEKEQEKEDKKAQTALEKEQDHDDEKGEKKRGLLDKILHPRHKSEDKEGRSSHDDGHNKLHKKSADPDIPAHTSKEYEAAIHQPAHGNPSDRVMHPPAEEGVAGPDWDAINKANNPS